jgi:type IV pilus assembly protein PilM
MAKKIVTLYVDDASIRLLVTQGNQVRKWADMPLEPGLVKSAVVIKEAEVARKIKQLLKAEKVGENKVIVGLSGLHCLSRPLTFPQLPKAMLAEAVMREAKRVLPVPVEQLYISWQTVPAPEGKTQVYLIAIPRKTADAMVKTMHQARLKPYLMDLKPLALARVVKEATAIIVNVEPTELDIIIMADGVPHPIRTIPLPSKALSWQEKLPMIRDEIDRTIKFYNSNYKDKPLAQSTPIFISGELADKPKAAQSLSDGLGYPVLPLASPLECPEQLDPSHYMVNIGLALKELWPERKAEASVVNLNALPTPYQPKPVSWVKVIAIPIIIAVVAGIAPLLMTVQSGYANIDSIRDQLDMTTQLLRRKQSERQELRNGIVELEEQVAEAEAARDNFTAAIDSLGKEGGGVEHNLHVATTALPSTINLAIINHTEDTVTISGKSPSEVEILQYAQTLDDSGLFTEVLIASIRRVECESTEGEDAEGEDTEGEDSEGEGTEDEITVEESMDFTLILRIRG